IAGWDFAKLTVPGTVNFPRSRGEDCLPGKFTAPGPVNRPESQLEIADWEVCHLGGFVSDGPSTRSSECSAPEPRPNFRCWHALLRRVEVLPPCAVELPALRIGAEVHWKLGAPER